MPKQYINGELADLNPEQIALVDQQKIDWIETVKKRDATEYKRKRATEYLSWGDQLDMMYHSMDDWKAHVKAVKDKYPKP